MFRHLPPTLVGTRHHILRPEQGTLWALDFVVADSRGQAARQGASGVAALHAEQRKQAKYRPACAATPCHSLLPIAIETFGGAGASRESFIKTLLRLRSARLSHIDERRLRRGAGRA